MAGECRAFERPDYAVRGARPYDQNWIDSTIEGGVGACGWKRPAPRPASIDGVAAPAQKRKAPGFVSRVKARLAPVAQPAPVEVAAPIVVPPKPRDPVDALLQGD